MAISFTGQTAAAADNVALPSHVAGDLIVIFAYNDSASLAPALPAGYTTAGGQNSAANTQGHRLGYKIAASSSETSGSWTNATGVIAHVYRGADQSIPIGASATATNIAAVTYPALTLQNTDGTSWVASFVGIRVASQPVETPPSGSVNRSDQIIGTSAEVAGHDTNGGVTSWSAVTGGGTGFRYRTSSIEIRAAVASGVIGQASSALASLTGSAAGGMLLSASAAAVLGILAASSSGAVTIAAASYTALLAASGAASGSLIVRGQAAGGLAALTGSASGSLAAQAAIEGTAALTLSPLSSSANGAIRLAGESVSILAPLIATAGGELAVAGSANVSLIGVIAAASGIGAPNGPLYSPERRTAHSAYLRRVSASFGRSRLAVSLGR